MKVTILNTGSSHAIQRSISIAQYCDVEKFIQIGEINNYYEEKLKASNIDLIVFNVKGFVAKKISKYISENTSSDCYICHYAKGVHVDACIYARVKCLIIIAMGSDLLNTKTNWLERIKLKLTLKSAEYFSVKSNELKLKLTDLGISSRIDINYWGENENDFYFIPNTHAKAQLGFKNNQTIFLSSRTINELYNIDLILESFYAINTIVDDAYFIFAGKIANLKYYEKIQADLIEKGLENFMFLGEISKEKLNLLYNAATIIYSFASREGTPNTIFEIFASKANLIIGEIETLKKFSYDTGAQLVFSAYTVEAIVKATLNVLETKNEYNKEHNYAVFRKFGVLSDNSKNFIFKANEIAHIVRTRNRPTIKLFLIDLLFVLIKRTKRIY